MTSEAYVKKVEEWFSNNLSNRCVDILDIFKEKKIQMVSSRDMPKKYIILKIIEGDIVLIKADEHGGSHTGSGISYFLLYQRNQTFIRLIFPFEEKNYLIKLVEEKGEKL
jgi:hypothetical protein